MLAEGSTRKEKRGSSMLGIHGGTVEERAGKCNLFAERTIIEEKNVTRERAETYTGDKMTRIIPLQGQTPWAPDQCPSQTQGSLEVTEAHRDTMEGRTPAFCLL